MGNFDMSRSKIMIDEIKQKLIEGNNKYQWKIIQETEKLSGQTKLKYPTLVLTCMDPRIDIHRIFQLEPGDVYVLRNAGNVYTEDVLRSILIAVYELNVKNIIILGHLDCRMTKIHLSRLMNKLSKPALKKVSHYATNFELSMQMFFKTFIDEVKNINNQVDRLRSAEELPSFIRIIGMLYDPYSGWIFESEELKKYPFTENFKRDYKKIIEKKKMNLIDYFESIEKDIIGETIAEPIESSSTINVDERNENDLTDLEIIEEQKIDEVDVEEKQLNSLKEQEDIIATYQTALQSIQKIRIPTIYIPKINITIPKVYRIKRKRD